MIISNDCDKIFNEIWIMNNTGREGELYFTFRIKDNSEHVAIICYYNDDWYNKNYCLDILDEIFYLNTWSECLNIFYLKGIINVIECHIVETINI